MFILSRINISGAPQRAQGYESQGSVARDSIGPFLFACHKTTSSSSTSAEPGLFPPSLPPKSLRAVEIAAVEYSKAKDVESGRKK